MGQVNLTNIMDGIASSLTSASVVTQVYAYPVDSVTVPCAVVGYPESITFDLTYGRGGDELSIPVWFVVGLTSTKDARDRLSNIIAGAASIKTALDGAHAWGDARVIDANVDQIAINGVTYLSAKFDIDIVT